VEHDGYPPDAELAGDPRPQPEPIPEVARRPRDRLKNIITNRDDLELDS
jgi:hypothetical protein